MVYMLIALLLIGYILNELSKKYSFYKLSYKRNLSRTEVEIGEEFDITTIIENNKVLPVSFLQVIEKIPAQLSYKFETNLLSVGEHVEHKTTMFLLPKQRIKRTFKVSFKRRGLYIFNDVRLISGDFLGTSSVGTDVEYLQQMVVYPESLSLEKELEPLGSYYGDISVNRWIISDPILTVGVREYTSLDPQKSIHWPSSLKTGRLMVKNFDFTTDYKVMIILNIECARPFWADINVEEIERCISIARGVMEELEELGISYGFATNIQNGVLSKGKGFIPYGYGTAHFYGLLDFLGRASYSINCGYEELLDNLMHHHENNVTYVMITPRILEEYVDTINAMSRGVEKSVLISVNRANADRLNENIVTYVGREK